MADILAHYYSNLVKQYNIDLTMKLDIESDVKIAAEDLSALLSNLLENAVESCLKQAENKRFITISAKSQAGILTIQVENSCTYADKSSLGFLSTKKRGRTGYGLYSIKSTAKKYNGTTNFSFDEKREIFISYVTLEV